jgi:hypothetical protein
MTEGKTRKTLMDVESVEVFGKFKLVRYRLKRMKHTVVHISSVTPPSGCIIPEYLPPCITFHEIQLEPTCHSCFLASNSSSSSNIPDTPAAPFILIFDFILFFVADRNFLKTACNYQHQSQNHINLET